MFFSLALLIFFIHRALSPRSSPQVNPHVYTMSESSLFSYLFQFHSHLSHCQHATNYIFWYNFYFIFQIVNIYLLKFVHLFIHLFICYAIFCDDFYMYFMIISMIFYENYFSLLSITCCITSIICIGVL